MTIVVFNNLVKDLLVCLFKMQSDTKKTRQRQKEADGDFFIYWFTPRTPTTAMAGFYPDLTHGGKDQGT